MILVFIVRAACPPEIVCINPKTVSALPSPPLHVLNNFTQLDAAGTRLGDLPLNWAYYPATNCRLWEEYFP